MTFSKVVMDRESGRSRGFGFVAFAQEQSMFTAIERMNGRELGGRQITVNQAGNGLLRTTTSTRSTLNLLLRSGTVCVSIRPDGKSCGLV